MQLQDVKSKFTSKMPTNKTLRSAFQAYLVFVSICVLFTLYRNYTFSGNPLILMLPNFVMGLTPFMYTAARMFDYFLDYESLPIQEKQHIAEIFPDADGNLDFEAIRRATENFREPAVVRGLFKDTPAVNKWAKPGYLEHRFSNFSMLVNQNGRADRDINDNVYMNMGESAKAIVEDRTSTQMLFFPKEERNLDIIEMVHNLTNSDLEVQKKLWRGFGTETHKTYIFAQVIAANGFTDKAGGVTSGTWWHCAFGNNWFAQVAGKKRWYFVSQKYSAYMKPGRKSRAAFRSPLEIVDFEKHLPVKYVDLQAGDMMYNPDWYWHRIENYAGLSIGVPLREKNFTNAFRNNFQYTSLTLFSIFMKKLSGYEFPIWGQDIREL